MRVKTDARRTAIVHAAWEVFREQGFQGASMSEISARVGGSKTTLYGYFKSKEELFFAAMEEALAEQAEQAFAQLSTPAPLRERLTNFAKSYLMLRLNGDLIAVDRMLIAEACRSNLCELLRAEHIVPKWQRVGAVLAEAMEKGELRRADSYRAAIQFRALIEADLVDRVLHGELDKVDPAEVAAEVELGVDAFLRAYAP